MGDSKKTYGPHEFRWIQGDNIHWLLDRFLWSKKDMHHLDEHVGSYANVRKVVAAFKVLMNQQIISPQPQVVVKYLKENPETSTMEFLNQKPFIKQGEKRDAKSKEQMVEGGDKNKRATQVKYV